jgi:maltose-binding protein MalE
MSKKKFYYYVLVFTREGPMFVTGLDYQTRNATWDYKKQPYAFKDQQIADDIALGLNWNGNRAFCVSSSWEIKDHGYRYSNYDVKIVPRENDNAN